jgi:prepilin-type N-terminal cleavage/methylation domain-containing protein
MPTSSKSGFTLVEILVAVSIVGVIALIGLPVYTNLQKSARDAKRIVDLHEIQTALEQNFATSHFYPSSKPNDELGPGKIGNTYMSMTLAEFEAKYFPDGMPSDPLDPATDSDIYTPEEEHQYTYYKYSQCPNSSGGTHWKYILCTKFEAKTGNRSSLPHKDPQPWVSSNHPACQLAEQGTGPYFCVGSVLN